MLKKKERNESKEVALAKGDIKEICGHKEQLENVMDNRQELSCIMVA